MDTSTQQALVRLVEATQLVATRTSLVHAGAPSLLGQLLPTALQLWSQDGLPSQRKGGSEKQDPVLLSSSKRFSATATRLAAEMSSSGHETMPQHCAAVTAVAAQLPKAHSVGEQGCLSTPISPRMELRQLSADAADYRPLVSHYTSSRGHNSQLELCSYREPSEADVDPCNTTGDLSDSLAEQRLDSWDSHAALAQSGPGSPAGQIGTAEPAPDGVRQSMSASEYLFIEEDDDRGEGATDGSLDSLDAKSAMSVMSPACQQLLLLLRVLRNLCATGSDATQALAEVGVPAQVAHLVSTCIQSATEGKAQLSKVAAQLLANMSANEGRALHAVWAGCFPGAFADLAALPRDVHGPLCRALLHCCSASSDYAAALCSPSGSPILRRLMVLEARAHNAEGGEMVMELGWLMGHLVYVRGLLPELFGALAEVQPPAPKPEQAGACGGVADGEGEAVAKARLDPLQCVLLELLSEEMEHGSTGQQLKVLSQGAPGKAERSLLFLVTTVRELGLALADTRGEPCLEASVLEAAFQVLKDLYALDDGGASLAAGTDLGSALFRMGLVHLLLGFLLALGPIRPRTRAAPESAAAAAAPQASQGEAFCASAAASVQSAAAGLPKHPPYLGYRTDIVAVLSHASYKRPVVQKEILRLGGVPLMLTQCQVDDSSPMVREWAMWGLRNLCEGNDSVQQAILDLQPVAPVQDPQLRQMGLQVELNPATGKLSVVTSTDVSRSQAAEGCRSRAAS